MSKKCKPCSRGLGSTGSNPCTTKKTVRGWEISLPARGGARHQNTVYVDGPKWSDSAIRYPDGRFAWDFPERVPADVKKAAKKLLNDCLGPAKGWR